MKFKWRLLLLVLNLPSLITMADSSIDPAHPDAYGANIGWVNLRSDSTNGVSIGPFYCRGYVWSPNCGWIALGNGPTNGWQYSNVSIADWGVNHDGTGQLRGYAYSANAGWITFEQNWGLPRVDLRTGILSGSAWGANIGWIGFSNAQAYVRTASFETGPDTDVDGIPDAWEYARAGGLTPLAGGGVDQDGDGASDVDEYRADTDPGDPGDYFRVIALAASGTTHQVEWANRPTRLYRLEATNTLSGSPGDWDDVGGGLLGPVPDSTITKTRTGVLATTQFYRVQSVLPLAP